KWLRARGSANKKAGKGTKPTARVVVVEISPEERRRQAAAQRESEKASRQRVKKIETRTATIDTELAALEARLADPATYNGPTTEMAKLGQRQAELRQEKDALETEWLGLVEQLEA
ncbi:MAG: ABC transporter ATP-binding protein, partial [Rhodanobacter sp.]